MSTKKPLRSKLASSVSRSAAALSRATGRGDGSVIGGRLGLMIDPNLLANLATGRDIALISGTNGKTTTTRLTAAAMGVLGRVATNSYGANMPTGHTSALARAGDTPYAVLEVDEHYLPQVLRATRPKVVALLNLSRDQLDRAKEVAMIAQLWRDTLAKHPVHAVANADDPMIVWAAQASETTGAGVTWVAAGQRWHDDSWVCPQCGSHIERADGTQSPPIAADFAPVAPDLPGTDEPRTAAYDLALDEATVHELALDKATTREPATRNSASGEATAHVRALDETGVLAVVPIAAAAAETDTDDTDTDSDTAETNAAEPAPAESDRTEPDPAESDPAEAVPAPTEIVVEVVGLLATPTDESAEAPQVVAVAIESADEPELAAPAPFVASVTPEPIDAAGVTADPVEIDIDTMPVVPVEGAMTQPAPTTVANAAVTRASTDAGIAANTAEMAANTTGIAANTTGIAANTWATSDTQAAPAHPAPEAAQAPGAPATAASASEPPTPGGDDWWCTGCALRRPTPQWHVEGDAVVDPTGRRHVVTLALPGRVNRANAATALAVASRFGVDPADAVPRLADVASVAGRYAQVDRDGRNIRLLLAKNPAGWLEAFDMAENAPTLLSINSRDPDGFDTSWLFDVDFSPLHGRRVFITGERAFDLAVRLEVNDIAFAHVKTFGDAVAAAPPGRLEVIANYTAFQDIRAELDRVN